MYDTFLILYILLQGYPGMQGGAGAPGPVGAAVILPFLSSIFFVFRLVRSLLVCLFVCYVRVFKKEVNSQKICCFYWTNVHGQSNL